MTVVFLDLKTNYTVKYMKCHTTSTSDHLPVLFQMKHKPCTFFCQLSTVAPPGWKEPLLRVQCIIKLFFIFSFLLHYLNIQCSSDFFEIYLTLYRNIWYKHCCWFFFYFYLLCHLSERLQCIRPCSALWRCITEFKLDKVYHPLMRWAHFNKDVHISIFMTSFAPCRWMSHR